MKFVLGAVLGLSLILVCIAYAADATMNAAPDHVMMSPDQVKWEASEFPGVSLAVMQGDPSKVGEPFTLWVKFPAGYVFAPHWHPTDESVIVMDGKLGMGMGDTVDKSSAEMVSGSYARVSKEVHHYAWSQKGAIIAIYGMGPFGVTYVNPQDDPRAKAKP